MADDNPERCIGCEDELRVDVQNMTHTRVHGERVDSHQITQKYCNNHKCARFGLVTHLVLKGK